MRSRTATSKPANWICAFPASNSPVCRRFNAMEAIALSVLATGALAGGFVSGLAGFGTGLVALGIWLYVFPPSVAVPLVLICSVVSQTSTLLHFWRLIDFKLVWPFLIGGLAGVL